MGTDEFILPTNFTKTTNCYVANGDPLITRPLGFFPWWQRLRISFSIALLTVHVLQR